MFTFTFKPMVFPAVKSASEAKLQSNVVERSFSLLAEGYVVKEAKEVIPTMDAPLLWLVISPKGEKYVVDGWKGTCDCPCFQKNNFCKHYGHIERELAQIAKLEAENEFAQYA